jgi:hypothetical protein
MAATPRAVNSSAMSVRTTGNPPERRPELCPRPSARLRHQHLLHLHVVPPSTDHGPADPRDTRAGSLSCPRRPTSCFLGGVDEAMDGSLRQHYYRRKRELRSSTRSDRDERPPRRCLLMSQAGPDAEQSLHEADKPLNEMKRRRVVSV